MSNQCNKNQLLMSFLLQGLILSPGYVLVIPPLSTWQKSNRIEPVYVERRRPSRAEGDTSYVNCFVFMLP